jgi:WD40 repeat protein
VWDAATGKPVTGPLEHHAAVMSAAFSPDGTRVVTASRDKTARVWDVRLDEGTLEQWSAVVERSPYVLFLGTHVRRVLLHLESQSSKPL